MISDIYVYESRIAVTQSGKEFSVRVQISRVTYVRMELTHKYNLKKNGRLSILEKCDNYGKQYLFIS